MSASTPKRLGVDSWKATSLSESDVRRLDSELRCGEVSWNALAARFKISPTRVSERAKELGIPSRVDRGPRRELKEAELARLDAELRRNLISWDRLSKRFGISRHRVSKRAAEIGVPQRTRAERAEVLTYGDPRDE